MDWKALQPRVRRAILHERRHRTIPDIAKELRAGRSTVYRMLDGSVTPMPLVQEQAERFVEDHPDSGSHLGRSTAEDLSE